MKKIESYLKYFITKDGKIFTKCHNKYLKPDLSTDYKRVTLYNNGKRCKFLIHRLVALAYIPNPYNLSQVNHINGVKTDNRVENLEWCSAKENTQHSVKIESFGKSKLTIKQVKEIKIRLSNDELGKDIAKKYNVTPSTISYIKTNKRWDKIFLPER